MGGRFDPPVNILITVLHEYMHGNGAADLTPVLAERSAPRTFTMYIFTYIIREQATLWRKQHIALIESLRAQGVLQMQLHAPHNL